MIPSNALRELQGRLAIVTSDRLPPGWSRGTTVFVDIGVASRLQRAVLRKEGVVHAPLADLAEWQAWIDLRNAMADASSGAWLTARLRLEASGAYRFEFDWDSEPVWPVEVDLDGNVVKSERVETAALREDLRRHPRADEFIPAWLQERLSANGVRFADDWREEFTPLAEDSNWLILREMVRDAVRAGTDDHGGAVESDRVAEVVASELAAATSVGQIDRLYRDVVGLGIVPAVPETSSAASAYTRDALAEDGPFRRRFDALFDPLVLLASQEIDNVVPSHRPDG